MRIGPKKGAVRENGALRRVTLQALWIRVTRKTTPPNPVHTHESNGIWHVLGVVFTDTGTVGALLCWNAGVSFPGSSPRESISVSVCEQTPWSGTKRTSTTS
jgi:hypothetical protein